MQSPPSEGPIRRRAAHLIDGAGPALVYDLERSFVIELPEALRSLDFDNDRDPRLAEWLAEKGLLTRSEKPIWSEPDNTEAPQITDVSLDLPGACNMGCRYCFENPINSRIGRMSAKTMHTSLDFAFAQAKGAETVAIHFGSGEPLIEFALLRELVAEATARADEQGQNVTFELTTNATLVTEEIARFLAAHPFNLRVSCDGPAEVHNRNRPMLNGRNSYSLVERGLKILLEYLPDRLTVNTVLCSETRLATVYDWARLLDLRHFHTIKVGSPADAPEALRADELTDYERDLATICDDLFADLEDGRRPMDYQPITKTVRRLMIPVPITRFCGVAGSYVGIASNGEIYPCFRHLGLDEYHMGSVFEGVDDVKRAAFRRNEAADVDSRPGCRDCWARYMCGGGCYADSVVYGPDKLAPKEEHCIFWRAEISAAIRFYDRLRRTDPFFALALFGQAPESVLGGLDHGTLQFLESGRTF